MKKKTFLRLQKRLEKLPLHHIDTSIILEPEKTENGRYCQKYLQKVGYNFKGKISFPVLSELFLAILRLSSYSTKHNLLDMIERLINIKKIGLYSPKDISFILEIIKRIDERIKPLDREILSCAVEDESNLLVTLDKDIIHNEKLEKEFGIEIRHPKELL